jgi:hypothetical protein
VAGVGTAVGLACTVSAGIIEAVGTSVGAMNDVVLESVRFAPASGDGLDAFSLPPPQPASNATMRSNTAKRFVTRASLGFSEEGLMMPHQFLHGNTHTSTISVSTAQLTSVDRANGPL